MDHLLFQTDMADNPAAAIAVLNERTTALSREIRELKDSHKEQMAKMERNQDLLASKLDDVLTAMHEAKGGWRTVMLMGGVATTLSGGIAWAIGHFANRGG